MKHIFVCILCVCCFCAALNAYSGMVFVKGGEFSMGSETTVTVSPFYIGKYEVTQQEWERVMGTNPSYCKGDNLPVENVSWYDIIEYCNKRSLAEGLTPCYEGSGNNITCDWSADGYRLPSEAEWEYAARGGSKSKNFIYSGSNNVDNVAWHYNNSDEKTHPAGTKAENELGIHDMSGNVWEWCWDWYDAYSGGTQIDPRGPSYGFSRVLRGGGCLFIADFCRTMDRVKYSPDSKFSFGGFRLARSIK